MKNAAETVGSNERGMCLTTTKSLPHISSSFSDTFTYENCWDSANSREPPGGEFWARKLLAGKALAAHEVASPRGCPGFLLPSPSGLPLTVPKPEVAEWSLRLLSLGSNFLQTRLPFSHGSRWSLQGQWAEVLWSRLWERCLPTHPSSGRWLGPLEQIQDRQFIPIPAVVAGPLVGGWLPLQRASLERNPVCGVAEAHGASGSCRSPQLALASFFL